MAWTTRGGQFTKTDFEIAGGGAALLQSPGLGVTIDEGALIALMASSPGP